MNFRRGPVLFSACVLVLTGAACGQTRAHDVSLITAAQQTESAGRFRFVGEVEYPDVEIPEGLGDAVEVIGKDLELSGDDPPRIEGQVDLEAEHWWFGSLATPRRGADVVIAGDKTFMWSEHIPPDHRPATPWVEFDEPSQAWPHFPAELSVDFRTS